MCFFEIFFNILDLCVILRLCKWPPCPSLSYTAKSDKTWGSSEFDTLLFSSRSVSIDFFNIPEIPKLLDS